MQKGHCFDRDFVWHLHSIIHQGQDLLNIVKFSDKMKTLFEFEYL